MVIHNRHVRSERRHAKQVMVRAAADEIDLQRKEFCNALFHEGVGIVHYDLHVDLRALR